MKYSFNGIITSYKKYKIPFNISDSQIRFNVSSLPDEEVRENKYKGVEINGRISSFSEEFFEGKTNDGKLIKIHARGIYDDKYVFDYSGKYLFGFAISCIVLDQNKFKSNIDKIGFYSLDISKITNISISGAIDFKTLLSLGKNLSIANFTCNDNQYYLNIDFLNKIPFCSQQIITVSSTANLTTKMLEDIYYVMKKMFIFAYQEKEVPLLDVLLFEGEEKVGHLFIEKESEKQTFEIDHHCLGIGSWNEKASSLLQALSDNKIYLRHLPLIKKDKTMYTPSRFLITVVGLESVLNEIGIKTNHKEKHKLAIENIQNTIKKHLETASGYEKKEYKRLLEILSDERFEDKVLVAINENKDYISNFFLLSTIGKTNEEIANLIAKSRNYFAHGYLDEELNNKHVQICNFLDLFILYLQLLQIGFDKSEASQIVPLVLFGY